MTEKKARMEILLIGLKAIRSVFFNLFMLVLGFILGFGFYKQCHKVFDNQDYVKFQSWVHNTRCVDQMTPTNRVPRKGGGENIGGKSDL